MRADKLQRQLLSNKHNLFKQTCSSSLPLSLWRPPSPLLHATPSRSTTSPTANAQSTRPRSPHSPTEIVTPTSGTASVAQASQAAILRKTTATATSTRMATAKTTLTLSTPTKMETKKRATAVPVAWFSPSSAILRTPHRRNRTSTANCRTCTLPLRSVATPTNNATNH